MAVALLLLLAACTRVSPDSSDEVAAFRAYFASWGRGDAALSRTIIGDEGSQLKAAVVSLIEGGAVEATVDDIERDPKIPHTLEGRARLFFEDSGSLELTSRASIRSDRVVAAPSVISTSLTDWAPLRIEASGDPARGKILSLQGHSLATGAEGARAVSDPSLVAAMALIDEAMDSRLAGSKARRLIAGESTLLAESAVVDGADLKTSIDLDLQAAAESSFANVPGALIVVDPRTGGIRALVSKPHPGEPERSPASSAYSPGSTFKIVTALSALENSTFEIDEGLLCPSQITAGERQITNFAGREYGRVSFKKAFAISCNTAFARIGMTLGAQRLLRTAGKLGFRIGDSGDAAITAPKTLGELAIRSFGADGVLTSPIRIADIGVVAAREGVRMPIGWIDRRGSGARVVPSDAGRDLLRMMEEVVRSGTGKSAAVPGAQVAGKTGTADPPPGEDAAGIKPDAWFVGLAPSHETRLVVVVFVRRGGIGGESAAPIFHNFLIATRNDWGR